MTRANDRSKRHTGIRRGRRELALQRAAKAWELRTRDWSEERIAAELEVSQSGVSRMLKRSADRLLTDMEGTILRYKAEQTRIHEHLVREVLEAWERSKEAAQSETRKSGAADADSRARPGGQLTSKVEERVGPAPPTPRPGTADLRRDRRHLRGVMLTAGFAISRPRRAHPSGSRKRKEIPEFLAH